MLKIVSLLHLCNTAPTGPDVARVPTRMSWTTTGDPGLIRTFEEFADIRDANIFNVAFEYNLPAPSPSSVAEAVAAGNHGLGNADWPGIAYERVIVTESFNLVVLGIEPLAHGTTDDDYLFNTSIVEAAYALLAESESERAVAHEAYEFIAGVLESVDPQFAYIGKHYICLYSSHWC